MLQTPNLPLDATQAQIGAIQAIFNTSTILYKQVDNYNYYVKQLVIRAVEDMFMARLKHCHVKCNNVTMLHLLNHLYQNYANIIPGNLVNNSTKMNKDYHTNLPINTLFGRIQDCIYFA